MPYPIDRKLVIAIASSALFDLSESNKIFREKGVAAYKKFHKSETQFSLVPQNLDHIDNIPLVHVPFGIINGSGS